MCKQQCEAASYKSRVFCKDGCKCTVKLEMAKMGFGRLLAVTSTIIVYGSLAMNAYYRDKVSDEDRAARRSLIQDMPEIEPVQDGSKAALYKQLQDTRHKLALLEQIEFRIERRLRELSSVRATQ